jgi:hypothetical protein
MPAWFERMAARERAALLAWTSALILATALPLSYWKAPQECFYSPEDFARCDPWRAIGALAEASAAALMTAALWMTRNPATTRPQSAVRAAGGLGLLLAIAGGLTAVVGDAYLIARQIAAVGYAALGLALFVESDRGNFLVRSRLGMLLGITLAIWALSYFPRDDQILPMGGSFFFIPYVVWAARLGYRLGTNRTPTTRKARPVELKLVGDLGAIVLFFLAFPFWITSTFGVATLGDPSNDVTVKNETGEAIIFYEDRRVTAYRKRIAAGETKAWGWLEHGAYSPAAEDLTGAKIFCRYLLDRELRRSHYLITVIREPSSCSSR